MRHLPGIRRLVAGPLSSVVLVVAVASAACAGSRGGAPPGTVPEPGPPEASTRLADLDATLWVQTSAEYAGLTLQAYRTARRRLDRALADSSWTAAREQEEPYRRKPPAVILDVDETVLDNSPYQARLLRRGEAFASDTWDAWVREARAPAVPGALDFTRYARERGVRVFYVTNRDAHLEEATRENLRRLGFPVDTTTDVALLQGERPGWDDKAERRALVARSHRILLLVGDDLHDFAAADQRGGYARTESPGAHAPPDSVPVPGERPWGERWIVLPNPIYGSWEEALFPGGRPSSPEAGAREKLRRLEPLLPPASGG